MMKRSSLLEMDVIPVFVVKGKSIVQITHAKSIVKMMMIVTLDISVLKIHVETLKKEFALNAKTIRYVPLNMNLFVAAMVKPMEIYVKQPELV
jgi:hypothetical protein